MNRIATTACVLLTLATLASEGNAAEKASTTVPPAAAGAVPAGAYTLDKAHASLLFRVDHLGFSHFTARFTRFDAQLQFDPAKPETSSVKVTIDPRSMDSDNAPAGFMDMLRGAQWLEAAKFPDMTFTSKKVTSTGPHALRIQGDLTLHGVTRPMTLNATYNGGYVGHPMDPHARVGFSAQGSLKRSDFGISLGIPAPGTTMGVGDAVNVIIEAELSGPAWAGAPAQ